MTAQMSAPAMGSMASMTSESCQSVTMSMTTLPMIIVTARSSSDRPELENMRTTSTSLVRRVISWPVCR
jgi:hypothetical protein